MVGFLSSLWADDRHVSLALVHLESRSQSACPGSDPRGFVHWLEAPVHCCCLHTSTFSAITEVWTGSETSFMRGRVGWPRSEQWRWKCDYEISTCQMCVSVSVFLSKHLMWFGRFVSPDSPCSWGALFDLDLFLLMVIWSQAREEEVYFHTHCTAVEVQMQSPPKWRPLFKNARLVLFFFKLIGAPRELCVMRTSWALLQGTADCAKVLPQHPCDPSMNRSIERFPQSHVWSLQLGGCTLHSP